MTTHDERTRTTLGAIASTRAALGAWIAIAALVVIVGVLVGMLLYPAITTTKGERIADDVAAAWNSRDASRIRDLYAESAVVYVIPGETYRGLDEIVAAGSQSTYRFERTGAITESPMGIAHPATVTNAAGGSADGLLILVVGRGDKVILQWLIFPMGVALGA